jgi:hypothetical protein
LKKLGYLWIFVDIYLGIDICSIYRYLTLGRKVVDILDYMVQLD